MSSILNFLGGKANISQHELKNIVDTASHRYKVYTIPKKNGSFRIINQPAKEIKFLQTILVKNLFAYFPIHSSVYSYRKNISVKHGALKHKDNNYILKVDFKNFFESIKAKDIIFHIKNKYPKFTAEDLEVITRIVCLKSKLTIGAPSSPVISNFILFDLDMKIHERCLDLGIAYSRYADDICFSTNQKDILKPFFEEFKDLLISNIHPKLELNHEKTVFTSNKHGRKITGIVLTTENRLSIGRDKKREIKALIHQYKNGNLNLEKIKILRGKLAYIRDIEPGFLLTMIAKYNAETIGKLLAENIYN